MHDQIILIHSLCVILRFICAINSTRQDFISVFFDADSQSEVRFFFFLAVALNFLSYNNNNNNNRY